MSSKPTVAEPTREQSRCRRYEQGRPLVTLADTCVHKMACRAPRPRTTCVSDWSSGDSCISSLSVGCRRAKVVRMWHSDASHTRRQPEASVARFACRVQHRRQSAAALVGKPSRAASLLERTRRTQVEDHADLAARRARRSERITTVRFRCPRASLMSFRRLGMMDPAYFVGRKAILEWLNGTFQMNLSKIEETASGECCSSATSSVRVRVLAC